MMIRLEQNRKRGGVSPIANNKAHIDVAVVQIAQNGTTMIVVTDLPDIRSSTAKSRKSRGSIRCPAAGRQDEMCDSNFRSKRNTLSLTREKAFILNHVKICAA